MLLDKIAILRKRVGNVILAFANPCGDLCCVLKDNILFLMETNKVKPNLRLFLYVDFCLNDSPPVSQNITKPAKLKIARVNNEEQFGTLAEVARRPIRWARDQQCAMTDRNASPQNTTPSVGSPPGDAIPPPAPGAKLRQVMRSKYLDRASRPEPTPVQHPPA
jgi:hypothetical protein